LIGNPWKPLLTPVKPAGACRLDTLQEEHRATEKAAKTKLSDLEERLEESMRETKKKQTQLKQITDQLTNVSSASGQLGKLQEKMAEEETKHLTEVGTDADGCSSPSGTPCCNAARACVHV